MPRNIPLALPVHRWIRTAGLLALLWSTATPSAAAPVKADAILVVDTSVSMREPGMDPERTSLLVSRLFADIVPGRLAIVRIVDVNQDQAALPMRTTDETRPCPDDPTQTCGVVEADDDWDAIARERTLGAQVRPRRADPGFKESLDEHLWPRAVSSQFVLSFRSAQGVFEQNGQDETSPRTVIWVSDGRPDDPESVRRILGELDAEGVALEAIVLGRGDPSLAQRAGLEVRQASTPRELMAAFSAAFRRVVRAPYDQEARIAEEPQFEMKPNVDEAWVVVYGAPGLEQVTLTDPSGKRYEADFADGTLKPAGAYRVAHFRDPEPGQWTVHATDAGTGAAYAVVQRSSLGPVLLDPDRAAAGVGTPLVAGIRGDDTTDGTVVTDPEVLEGARMSAEVDGRTISLNDDGIGGDRTAGDGRFTGIAQFEESGEAEIRLHLRTELVDRSVEVSLPVTGSFRYEGGPIELDLGAVRAGETSCRSLSLQTLQQGAVPFELRRFEEPPDGHILEIRGIPLERPLRPGDGSSLLEPASGAGTPLEVCLVTSRSAPSSTATGQPWLNLAVVGSERATHQVSIHLRWTVHGLSFWERWGRLILLVLAILALAVVIGGFVVPNRFSGSLALSFVPDRDELDEQSPQPIRQWKGIGVGFYRDARAFLHPDYRISGKARGALASLHARPRGARVSPAKGSALFRESIDGSWDDVASEGCPARAGDVYRIGERGPYFRISTRR